MAHFDSSVLIKREHFEHFRPMKLEHSNGNCPSGSSQPDYICLGNGCFVCERAAIQAMPENANWKKKVQSSIVAYQMEHTPEEPIYGGSFNLDSLRRLKPAESEKTKPFYIYDEKLGRKRRHDPWFAKHKVARDDPTSSPKRPDPKRKRTRTERDDNKQFHFQHAPFLLDRCIKTEPSPNNQFYSSSPISSSPLSSPILSSAPSTTLQPATIQTSDGQSSVECNLSNDNDNRVSCIEDLMPILSLQRIEFLDHDANSNENRLDDNATEPYDEYEWIMTVLNE